MKSWVRILVGMAAALMLSGQAQAGPGGVSVELRSSERAGAPVARTIELYRNSYALVIGNDAYSGAWPMLSNAVKDAVLVADALERRGFEVSLLTNLKSAELESALEEFFILKGGDPEARLFVWYAGHGHSERGEGYLVPVDAPDPSEEGLFRLRSLSLRRLGEYAREANAKHVYAVFDSCFAGTIFEVQRSRPPSAITEVTSYPVRQFMTSGEAGQEVSDDGTFRKLFLRAIDGQTRADANGDGYLTASEIGLFMADRITNYSNRRQTPRSGKLNDPDWDRGDFVFALAQPAETAATPSADRAGADVSSACMSMWDGIRDSALASDYEAFLSAFPNCVMASVARSRVVALNRQAAPFSSAGKRPVREPPAKPALTTLPEGLRGTGEWTGGHVDCGSTAYVVSRELLLAMGSETSLVSYERLGRQQAAVIEFSKRIEWSEGSRFKVAGKQGTYDGVYDATSNEVRVSYSEDGRRLCQFTLNR